MHDSLHGRDNKMEINRFAERIARYIWHVVINFAVINVPRFVKLYYTVLEQEEPRARGGRMSSWFCVREIRKRVTDGMQDSSKAL